jgi:hypothetical protein
MLTLTNYQALEDMGVSNMVDFFDTFMRINYDIKYRMGRAGAEGDDDGEEE